MPLVGWTIENASAGYDHEEWHARTQLGEYANVNGHMVEKSEDAMDVDVNPDNYGWEGAGAQDRLGLESVLKDCLAVGV
jgi:hypothetical protein